MQSTEVTTFNSPSTTEGDVVSLLFLNDQDELFPMVPSRFVSPRDGTTPDVRAPAADFPAIQVTTEVDDKKWWQSQDNTGWDDKIGWTLITWGTLGLAPGPSDAAAVVVGGGVARALGWGARGALFTTGMIAYGIPLIMIGTGFVLTRLD